MFPCLYELYRDGVVMTRMTVLQRGIGSMERAQVRDQPELHWTITESLYKVFIRLPGRVSQFLHQWTQYSKKASSQYSQYAKKVSSQDSLWFIHTSIPDCWLRRINQRFHLKTSCSRRKASKAKAVGGGLRHPRWGCHCTMRRPVSPAPSAWTWPSW